MKHISLFIATIFCSVLLFAQNTGNDLPPFMKTKKLPEFNLLQTDSTWFTHEQLPKADFTIIVYFSPDCGHCQYEAKEMMNNMDSLKNTFILWASYRDMADIKGFAETYGFGNYKNLKVGRDPTYGIPSFFQVKYTPYVAVYDKKGNYVKAFEGGVEMPELNKLLSSYKQQ
ncbi:MAG: TlpA family protein disulfide reductase [Sediminibacterium sp.]